MEPRSGRAEAVPYSFSRWTDVPASKWPWFLERLSAGKVEAFDPRVGTPSWWSLKPEETHSLVFWTKDPTNLLKSLRALRSYHLKINFTITGWTEVEHGVPSTDEAIRLYQTLSRRVGRKKVSWRFSPVPLVRDVVDRFDHIAHELKGYTKSVYLSFLQSNDRMPETRGRPVRVGTLERLASVAASHGIQVLLCNDDRPLWKSSRLEALRGVCVSPESVNGGPMPEAEKCGCSVMVDPFSFNEHCTMGCEYCYVSDRTLGGGKKNTTRSLLVVP